MRKQLFLPAAAGPTLRPKKRLAIIVSMLAISLAAAWALPAKADDFLPGDQLTALLGGSTLASKSHSGHPYYILLKTDGNYFFQLKGEKPLLGAWAVKDGKWCMTYPDGEYCAKVRQTGDRLDLVNDDGSPGENVYTKVAKADKWFKPK